MNVIASAVGAAALGALAMQPLPAAAHAQGEDWANRQEISLDGGQIFGDDLPGADVGGFAPTLADHVANDVRYGHFLTDSWSLEFSIGQSATNGTRFTEPDVNLDLTTFDADTLRHFARRGRWDPEVAFGASCALADLAQPIAGLVGSQAVMIEDDDYRLNAGIVGEYLATEPATSLLDARYRYYERLRDPVEHSTGTFGATVN